MSRLVALVLAVSVLGGCSKNVALGTLIGGAVVTGGGIALMATSEPNECDNGCLRINGQGIFGAMLTTLGGVALFTGGLGYAIAVTSESSRRRADELADRASRAARRGDCTEAQVSLQHLAEIDRPRSERVRQQDPAIAGCAP